MFNILSVNDKPNAGYICNGIKKSNVEVLHKQGFYGEGIKIGIVDTGIFPTHSFIKDNILCCKNFTNSNEDDYIDKNNHGTFVASEIVQIAPKCKLVIARALGKDGNGTYDMIYNALKYCIEQDVDAINMSLGGTQGDERLHSLIQEANRKGIPVFTAGGNEGDLNKNTDENSYPGSYEECINVEAVNLDLTVPKYSNSNKYVDIVCVGTNLVGAYLDNKWCNSTGSSMAAPIACAIGMLLKEKFIKEWNREPSEKEIFGELLKHTKDLNIDKRQQGHGFLYIKED